MAQVTTTNSTTWNNQLDPNKCTCPKCGNSDNRKYDISHFNGVRWVTCVKCDNSIPSSLLITKKELRKYKLLKIEKYEN